MRDGIPDLRRAALAVACVTAMCLAVLVLVAAPVQAQETAAEDQYVPGPDEQCPGAVVVGTITGTDNQIEPFTITGDALRVTYVVEFTVPAREFRLVDIEINDRFGLIESESVDEDRADSFLVPEGPGNFELEVDVEPENGANYTVTIEDCAGEDPTAPVDEDDNEDPGDLSDPEDVDEDTIPDQPLPDTGGLPLVGLVVLGLALLGVGSSVVRAGIGRRS